ncbi:MAG: S41 family peptidase [Cyclobacteriaceae bacterium]
MRQKIAIALCMISLSVFSQELTRKEINTITSQIPKLILENYVLSEKKVPLANAFLQKIESRKYVEINNPDSLAKVLTKDLREISLDKHLYVKYIEPNEKKQEFDWDAWESEERILEKKQNFGFTEIRILEGNIGYLKIVEFMHPQRGMQTAVATMKFVENTEGLIIDIRGNGGGYGGLMNYILNHYFDGGPTHISTTIYSEKDKLPNKEYSSDLVYGKLRVNTPLYIITDEKTGSAAEFFAYTLQSFGKAKIVGQATAGAAHMNSFYPLNETFRISISTGAPINPKTNTNWESVGVIPDYEIVENQIDRSLELILKDVKTATSKK